MILWSTKWLVTGVTVQMGMQGHKNMLETFCSRHVAGMSFGLLQSAAGPLLLTTVLESVL